MSLNADHISNQMVEEIKRDLGTSNDLKAVLFRSFNVTGAAESGGRHQIETDQILMMIKATSGKRDWRFIGTSGYSRLGNFCLPDYVYELVMFDFKAKFSNGSSKIKAPERSKREQVPASLSKTCSPGAKILMITLSTQFWPAHHGDAAALVSFSRPAVNSGWMTGRSALQHMITDARHWYQTSG